MTNAASSTLLDEYFDAADARFLDELFAQRAQTRLKRWAQRLAAEGGPFARQMRLRYIDDGCGRPGHRIFVKTLFNSLEAAGDDEAMGRFMVAFDRLIGARRRKTLRLNKAILAQRADAPYRAEEGLEREARSSTRARIDLCRRAFRYFRALGKADPARYERALCEALIHYDDEHLQRPAEALGSAEGLANLTVEEWIALLRAPSRLALTLLCELVARYVAPSRLSLEQCIELACRRPSPVAELGLRFAQTKSIQNEASVRAVAGVGKALAQRVRKEAVAWAVQVIERSPHSRPSHLRDLLDSPHEDVRRPSAAVMTRTLRFKDATELWAALAESPHDDARAFLLLHLTRRKSAFTPESLRHVWATALLAVQRGGGVKRAVLERVSDYMVAHPAEAEALLPLVAIALRSAREPERGAALAAVARAASREPSIRGAIAQALPDLKLFDEAAP